MSRFHSNEKSMWGGHRPDTFPNGASRRTHVGGRRGKSHFQRPPMEEDTIGRPSDEGHNDDSIGNKLDRLMDRMDKLDAWREETDRRFENLEYEDYRRKHNWDRNHHMGSVQTRRPTCWDPPGNRPLPSCQPYDPPQSRRPSCWEPPPRRTSREYSEYDKPPLGPPSRWDPPDYRCPQTLQPTRSGRPLSHRTAPCPVQLAAVSDYNEKLRIYRLEQATLLAQLNAWFEENIDDKNLAEDVPVNVAHNGGVNLDVPNNESLEEVPTDESLEEVPTDESLEEIVKPHDESLEEIVKPNDESLEEIVKTDNMPPQVLVGAYDGKIGDLIVPEHRELEIQDDIKTLVQENVVCHEDIVVLITSLFDRNIGATQINYKSSRSHIMFTGIIESWCRSSLQSSIRYQQRPLKFDPGGEASVIDHLHCFVISTLRTRRILTVGELIRASFSLDILG